MKSLRQLIKESEASDQAKQLGLQSAGFGRYKDPKTGKVTHRSQGGKLIPVGKSSEPKSDKRKNNVSKSEYDKPSFRASDRPWEKPPHTELAFKPLPSEFSAKGALNRYTSNTEVNSYLRNPERFIKKIDEKYTWNDEKEKRLENDQLLWTSNLSIALKNGQDTAQNIDQRTESNPFGEVNITDALNSDGTINKNSAWWGAVLTTAKRVNNYQRNQEIKNIENDSNDIREIFKNAPKTHRDITLLRGMNMPKTWVDELSLGKVLHDRGFSSTTENPEAAKRFAEEIMSAGGAVEEDRGRVPVILKIKTPKNTPYIPLGTYLKKYKTKNMDARLRMAAYDQAEVLLPNDLNMRVEKIEDNAGIKYVTVMIEQ